MHGYQFIVNDRALSLPWWWFDAVVAWAGVMGLVLWAFGRRLVKPMFIVMGLGSGALVASGIGLEMGFGQGAILWAAGGALVGAVAGFALWRVGVGLTVAIAAAVIGAAVAMTVTQTPAPALDPAIAQAQTDFQKDMASAAVDDIHANVTADHTADAVPLARPFAKAADPVGKALADWWGSSSAGARWIVAVSALGAGMLGFVLGMIFAERFAAAVMALCGAVMMLPAAAWVVGQLPEGVAAWVPRSMVGVGVVLGVLTVIGAVIQWTVFRKATDS